MVVYGKSIVSASEPFPQKETLHSSIICSVIFELCYCPPFCKSPYLCLPPHPFRSVRKEMLCLTLCLTYESGIDKSSSAMGAFCFNFNCCDVVPSVKQHHLLLLLLLLSAILLYQLYHIRVKSLFGQGKSA